MTKKISKKLPKKYTQKKYQKSFSIFQTQKPFFKSLQCKKKCGLHLSYKESEILKNFARPPRDALNEIF